ncbi:hypothetical protein FPF71_17740 [Algibacter amylolyticus]|uniref:Uncharacterized protein n=1 Tax=Algibacter amylolyticus TaxID=1608400 RepID=A0A5M7AZ91_9FLAO|nr:hypothetical protein [Algibacter amylolyticus]KAA5820435.1 hypothetical protein F2B50_17740 [Algibacter amylolyticus]MBB5269997.1 hypothetical protein [Algibacter amylolyticus]TSJ71064.1 hypothetical protein FPF71_17740 [Algibacter amylolyticus]
MTKQYAELKKLKSDFTINEIGKFQFYSGIAIGIGFSLIFNSLFRVFLKMCNVGEIITDLSWSNFYSYEFSIYYLTLIGFTSVGFSFCFTTYLWMSKPFATNRKKNIRLRMAQTNTIWILFGTLFFLLRLFWFFAGIDLTIEKDFAYLGFMFPIFIYLYCWNLISDIYKSKKTFLVTSLIVIFVGIILSGI